ncbi:MAG: acyl-CoA dehydrogenase family protein [Candidatus Sericytochromatia bacterium]|nr:acyl-CoA dehydrogenase family protein [Candidatus Sericytochromatia bacterium]
MSKFNSVDYYMLDDWLTDEEKMIRQAVRNYVDESFMPLIEECYMKGEFPFHLVPGLAELGVFGSSLQGYGCAGLNSMAYGLICQELERADSGLRSFVSVQSSLVMYPIHTFGSEEQKEKWLPKLAKGEAIGCFGLTEPDFGSNPTGMITRAKKDGDHYIINGAKMWITNGTVADVAVVWAKTEDDVITAFLVEKGTPGFSAPEIKNKHSLRASITSELIFQDVRIPAENMLPKSKGLKHALMCLNQARYGITWGVIGAAMDCYETALDYSKTRIQFDKPIASFQMVQEKLVWMLNEITKAQLICFRLGKLKDEGKIRPEHVSMAKMNNVKMAREVAMVAREILGANGVASEYPVMRHMNNIESVFTYEGTHDIHILTVGRDITGISAFI